MSLADKSAKPAKALSKEKWIAMCKATITTAGAVSSVSGDDGVSVAYASATGKYTVTYPACPNAVVILSIAKSTTVDSAAGSAQTDSSGTATWYTYNGGTAADPADGDILSVVVIGEPFSV